MTTVTKANCWTAPIQNGEPSHSSVLQPGDYVLCSAHVKDGRIEFIPIHGSPENDDHYLNGSANPGKTTPIDGMDVLHIHSPKVADDCAIIAGNTPFGPLSRSRDHVLYRWDGHPTMKEAELDEHDGIGCQYTDHWIIIRVEEPIPVSLTGSLLTIGDVTFDVNSGYAYELEDGTILRNDHLAHVLIGMDDPSDSDELDGEGVWSLFEVVPEARRAIAAMGDHVSRSLLATIADQERGGRRGHISFTHWVDGQDFNRNGPQVTVDTVQ